MRRLVLLPMFLLAALASVSHADVLNVDAAGGPDADFTSIQDAIDAAQPDDVILINGGFYDGFVLSKPLRIVGAPTLLGVNAVVFGTAVVRDLPAGTIAALANMSSEFVRVEQNAGTVFFDLYGVTPPTSSQGPDDLFCIEVIESADVRFRQVGVNPGNGSGRAGMLIDHSLVETEGVAIDGARGMPGVVGSPEGSAGGHGIVIRNQGTLRFHNGRVRGGNGGDALFSQTESFFGGNGGDALFVEPSAELVVGGNIFTQVFGGWVGRGSLLQAGPVNLCPLEGQPGAGVNVASGASARLSSAILLEGGVSFCFDDGPLIVNNGQLETVDPPNLNLHWDGGISQIGLGPSLDVNDLPGTVVTLFIGVEPLQVPIFKWKGNPLLVAPLIITNFSVIPPTGGFSVPASLPPNLPFGLTVIVQAAGQRPDGSFQLSNSTTGVTTPPPPMSCDPIECPVGS